MKKIAIFITLIIVFCFNQTIFSRAIICYNYGSSWKCYYHRNLDCGMIRESKWVVCVPQMVAFQDPTIYVDRKNNAVVSSDGKIIKIASDKFERELTKIGKIKELNIPKFLESLLINDNGFVSTKSLKKISTDINAKIIYTKVLPKTNHCPACDNKVK